MNNPPGFTDPLGLWAIEVVHSYKIKGHDADGNNIYETDRKGNKIVDQTTVYAYKTKDDDDGASLAKQLGLKGDEAKQFASQVGGNYVALSNTSGDTGKTYGAVEKGLTAQAEGQRKHGRSPDSANCAGTSCQIGLRNFFLGSIINPEDFDPVLKREGRSISEGDLRISDIVRYATDGGRTPQS